MLLRLRLLFIVVLIQSTQVVCMDSKSLSQKYIDTCNDIDKDYENKLKEFCKNSYKEKPEQRISSLNSKIQKNKESLEFKKKQIYVYSRTRYKIDDNQWKKSTDLIQARCRFSESYGSSLSDHRFIHDTKIDKDFMIMFKDTLKNKNINPARFNILLNTNCAYDIKPVVVDDINTHETPYIIMKDYGSIRVNSLLIERLSEPLLKKAFALFLVSCVEQSNSDFLSVLEKEKNIVIEKKDRVNCLLQSKLLLLYALQDKQSSDLLLALFYHRNMLFEDCDSAINYYKKLSFINHLHKCLAWLEIEQSAINSSENSCSIDMHQALQQKHFDKECQRRLAERCVDSDKIDLKKKVENLKVEMQLCKEILTGQHDKFTRDLIKKYKLFNGLIDRCKRLITYRIERSQDFDLSIIPYGFVIKDPMDPEFVELLKRTFIKKGFNPAEFMLIEAKKNYGVYPVKGWWSIKDGCKDYQKESGHIYIQSDLIASMSCRLKEAFALFLVSCLCQSNNDCFSTIECKKNITIQHKKLIRRSLLKQTILLQALSSREDAGLFKELFSKTNILCADSDEAIAFYKKIAEIDMLHTYLAWLEKHLLRKESVVSFIK